MMTSSPPTEEGRRPPLGLPAAALGPVHTERWPLMLVAADSLERSRRAARWELNSEYSGERRAGVREGGPVGPEQ